ncbi:peptidase C39 family protein [Wenjunlia tyrosinilytica]|uniref:Membrane protein n=1 Tax=Wenjunlia tyrosinilytica TaxID=1544741 RepID=A0A918DU37_9ACTN|nr:peptidase C39 family protein [Wenjunlia tyrosinilytica]GGO82169.1 membrane protein [Wenjunlia tyrosinilytica]
MTRPAPRRAVLAAAIAVAATAAAPKATAAPAALASPTAPGRHGKEGVPVDHHSWRSYFDWRSGSGQGVRVEGGSRPGIVIGHPAGTTEYTDPHTGRKSTWETSTWTSRDHAVTFGATELVASWNARTPAGTWIQVEMHGTYTDGTETPWYVMGRWAAGDADIKRTSVDDQTDAKSTVWTDTFSIDDATTGLRLASYRLRVTLYRAPGAKVSPKVWRAGAMASDIPDRFTVPASTPGLKAGAELTVPRYSQEIHKGQYPEYDNGGEAWCSPTSSQMVLEFYGRKPTPEDLSWVDPAFADPQVCHAARHTFDWQYSGCGNWPFNAAYAATYRDMEAVITRLSSLNDAERLVAAGIPVITSQSFLASELDGAGYGTSGHLMCVVGFTKDGDVIANDPASKDDGAVRRIYKRRQFENIWLRTKRYNAQGQVRSGTGGIAYIYWPRDPAPSQRRALLSVGIR